MPLLALAAVLLHGTVSIGPTTPVCRAGTPCTKAAVHVTLTFARAGRIVQTTTDGRGRYRISLVPGTWAVRTRVGMGIAPVKVVVPRAGALRRDFMIDTGIR